MEATEGARQPEAVAPPSESEGWSQPGPDIIGRDLRIGSPINQPHLLSSFSTSGTVQCKGVRGDEDVERNQGRPGDTGQMPGRGVGGVRGGGHAELPSTGVHVVTAPPWGAPFVWTLALLTTQGMSDRCPDFPVPWGTSLLGKSLPLYVLQFPYL